MVVSQFEKIREYCYKSINEIYKLSLLMKINLIICIIEVLLVVLAIILSLISQWQY
jgi:hypothetical protein